jgi:hypothetical protein
MPEKPPVKFELDTFDARFDSVEETCQVKLFGVSGEKVIIIMDREQAEEFAIELCQVLGLEPPDDDEADDD